MRFLRFFLVGCAFLPERAGTGTVAMDMGSRALLHGRRGGECLKTQAFRSHGSHSSPFLEKVYVRQGSVLSGFLNSRFDHTDN